MSAVRATDLVVIGGHSSGHQMTPGLGSVSVRVATRSIWPVLVARRETHMILLVVDGSAGARAATEFGATRRSSTH